MGLGWLPVAICTAVAVFALAPHLLTKTSGRDWICAQGEIATEFLGQADHAPLKEQSPFFADHSFLGVDAGDSVARTRSGN
jgi:hypothetical protein